jgi:multidrug efflux pump subunit AcrB
MLEIRRRLDRGLALPTDATVQYAGMWAEQRASFRGLVAVLAAVTALMAIILLIAFRSWRALAAVLLVIASALVGVFAALHLGGATFNISSFVGAIMTVGIVSENAYFLVASYRAARADGRPAQEAAVAAATRRARPVLMTTAAGLAALAPLALGLGSGATLLQPLAIAVIGGFCASAPLLLLVLPSLLARLGGGMD